MRVFRARFVKKINKFDKIEMMADFTFWISDFGFNRNTKPESYSYSTQFFIMLHKFAFFDYDYEDDVGNTELLISKLDTRNAQRVTRNPQRTLNLRTFEPRTQNPEPRT